MKMHVCFAKLRVPQSWISNGFRVWVENFLYLLMFRSTTALYSSMLIVEHRMLWHIYTTALRVWHFSTKNCHSLTIWMIQTFGSWNYLTVCNDLTIFVCVTSKLSKQVMFIVLHVYHPVNMFTTRCSLS